MTERQTAQRKQGARKVLIVDDHPAVREGLGVLISRQPDLEVCGEAADVTEALRLLRITNPDVAIIDISLRNGNGIDLIKRIQARQVAPRLLVWSMHADALYAERALRAGALGYINKGEATDKIIDAIHRVLEGKVYLSDVMSERMLHRSVGQLGKQAEGSPVEGLSDRELEVVELLGQGVDTRRIAQKMSVSRKTVETYRARIKDKLHLDSGTELIHWAVQWAAESR
jgi:DNA-binding NarL/FixJ family response regulator